MANGWSVKDIVRQFESQVIAGEVQPDVVAMLIEQQNNRGIVPDLHPMSIAMFLYLIRSPARFTIGKAGA